MIIRLSPEQIGSHWAILRPILAKALPASLGIQPKAMSNVLYTLLSEDAQLWVSYADEEGMARGEPMSVIMTAIVSEYVSKVRYMILYTMTALAPLDKELYEDGVDKLKDFALATGCAHIVTYVDNEARVRQLLSLGVKKVSTLMEL